MKTACTSTPVGLTGMQNSTSGSISDRDGPALVTSHHGRDGQVGSVRPTAKSKAPVLRLAFPFGARRKVVPPCPSSPPSPVPGSASELPVRHKHAFTPSPLRHTSEGSATVAQGRALNPASAFLAAFGSPSRPRHHGHSRHSLHFTKLVWTTRHAQHSASPSGPSAGALSPKVLTSHPKRAPLTRSVSSFYAEKKADQCPLAAYPRQGDILALRDPYCARADRSFAPVPLWTMSKILFLFALLLPKPRQDDCSDFFDDVGSEASFSGTESTLVDSDTEWDLSTTCSSRQDASEFDDISGDCTTHGGTPVSKGNLLSLAARQVNREPDASTVHMTSPAWLCRFYRDPRPGSIKLSLSQSRSRHHRNQNPTSMVWPACWYGLWELLIELAHRDAPANMGARDRGTEAKGARSPQPKEFRWLKLLGSGPKPASSSQHLKTLKVTSQLPSSVKLSPARSTSYEPSHSACG